MNHRVDLQPGFVSNFHEFLTLSDVFLFPSKAEGLGTPLLEAQACAIPIISNDIKGISDCIIEFGVGGFFLELDPLGWSKLIKQSLNIRCDTLLSNSKYINSLASSTVIDEEYFNKISRLISNSKIKVALLTSTFLPSLGGVEVGLHNIAIRLQARGLNVTVVAPFSSRNLFNLPYEVVTLRQKYSKFINICLSTFVI